MMPFVPWNPTPPLDDATLARRVADGDRDALAAVYARESGAVYRYALALCGNTSWAADATQDAFIAFASRAGSFDVSRGSLGAWLAGVARHALLAQWRAAFSEVAVDAPSHDVPGPETSLDALLVQREDAAALWAAIRALPWVFREALVLVDVQERRYEEAAAIAGVPVNTLRTRLHRARARLAAELNGAKGEAA